jgi:phage shock protein C
MGDAAGGALRRGRDRLIGGVCSGLAQAWRLDPALVRVVAAVLLFIPPLGPLVVIAYLVLWLVMPPPEGWQGTGPPLDARLRMAGNELRQDLDAALGRPDPGPGAEASRSRGGSAGLWIGGLLVVLGVYLLAQNLGLFAGFRWDLFWPVVIIGLGTLILFRRAR